MSNLAEKYDKPYISPEEYLVFERQAEFKHEYLDGEIIAMAGASYVHNLIFSNLMGELVNQLRGSTCRVLGSDMRLKVGESRLYTYPDLLVFCGEPQFNDDRFDTLLNPTLIVEILSPSTEAYDRGKKFAYYRQIDSLRDYLLVSQQEPRLERFACREGQWSLTEAFGLEGSLELETIGCRIVLSESYNGVTFPDPEELHRNMMQAFERDRRSDL